MATFDYLVKIGLDGKNFDAVVDTLLNNLKKLDKDIQLKVKDTTAISTINDISTKVTTLRNSLKDMPFTINNTKAKEAIAEITAIVSSLGDTLETMQTGMESTAGTAGGIRGKGRGGRGTDYRAMKTEMVDIARVTKRSVEANKGVFASPGAREAIKDVEDYASHLESLNKSYKTIDNTIVNMTDTTLIKLRNEMAQEQQLLVERQSRLESARKRYNSLEVAIAKTGSATTKETATLIARGKAIGILENREKAQATHIAKLEMQYKAIIPAHLKLQQAIVDTNKVRGKGEQQVKDAIINLSNLRKATTALIAKTGNEAEAMSQLRTSFGNLMGGATNVTSAINNIRTSLSSLHTSLTKKVTGKTLDAVANSASRFKRHLVEAKDITIDLNKTTKNVLRNLNQRVVGEQKVVTYNKEQLALKKKLAATEGAQKFTAKVYSPQLGRELSGQEKYFANINGIVDEISRKEYRRIKNQERLNDLAKGFGGIATNILKKFALWGIAYRTLISAWQYGKKILKDTLKTIVEMDRVAGQIVKVAPQMFAGAEGAKRISMVMKEAINVSIEYGTRMEDTAGAMTLFFQQGLGVTEALNRSRGAMELAAVSGIDLKQSVEILTAGYKIYGDAIKEPRDLTNQLIAVEQQHAITARELSRALLATGNTAVEMGIKLHELLGFVTAMGVSTRRTGKQIGTALRFILPRMLMGEAIEQFHRLGVTIYGLNQQGIPDLRAMGDVIHDVAVRWDGLRDAQKAYIAVSVAGRRRMNDFLALINNYPEALRAMQHALESEGRAEVALTAITARLDRQIISATNVFKRFAFLLGEAGVSRALSSMYSLIVKLGGGTDRARDKTLVLGDAMVAMAKAGEASLLNTIDLVDILLKRLDITPKIASEWGLITADIRNNMVKLVEQAKKLETAIEIPIRIIRPPQEVEAMVEKEYGRLAGLAIQAFSERGWETTEMLKEQRREAIRYEDTILTIPATISGVSFALEGLRHNLDKALTADDREKIKLYGQRLESLTEEVQKGIIERGVMTAKTIFDNTWAVLLEATERSSGKISEKATGTVSGVVYSMKKFKLLPEDFIDPTRISDLGIVFKALSEGMRSNDDITQRLSASWLQALGSVEDTRYILDETTRATVDLTEAERKQTAFLDALSKKRALESSNLVILRTSLSQLGAAYMDVYKAQANISIAISDRVKLQNLEIDGVNQLQIAYESHKEVFKKATQVYNDYIRVSNNVNAANIKLRDISIEVETELDSLPPALEKIARAGVHAMDGFLGTTEAQIAFVKALESKDAARAIDVLNTKTTIMNDQSAKAKQQYGILQQAIKDYVSIMRDAGTAEEDLIRIRDAEEKTTIRLRDALRSLKNISTDYQHEINKEKELLSYRLNELRALGAEESIIIKEQMKIRDVLYDMTREGIRKEITARRQLGVAISEDLAQQWKEAKQRKELDDIRDTNRLKIAILTEGINRYNQVIGDGLRLSERGRDILGRMGIKESELIKYQIQSIKASVDLYSIYKDVNKEKIKQLNITIKELEIQKKYIEQTERLNAAQLSVSLSGEKAALTTIGVTGITPGRKELMKMRVEYEASSAATAEIFKNSGLSINIQERLLNLLSMSDIYYNKQVNNRQVADTLMGIYISLVKDLNSLGLQGVEVEHVALQLSRLRLKGGKEFAVILDEQYQSKVNTLAADEALLDRSKQRETTISNIRQYLADEALYLTKSGDAQLDIIKQQRIQRALLEAQIATRERELVIETELSIRRLQLAREDATWTDAMSQSEDNRLQSLKDGIIALKLQNAELNRMDVISKDLLYLQDALNAAKSITAGLKAFAGQRYERLQEEDRIKKQIELEKQRIALQEATGKRPTRMITGEYADIRKLEIQLINTRKKSRDEIIEGVSVGVAQLEDVIESVRLKMVDEEEQLKLESMVQRLSNEFQGTVYTSAEIFYNKAVQAAYDFNTILTGGIPIATTGGGRIIGDTSMALTHSFTALSNSVINSSESMNKATSDFKKALYQQIGVFGPGLGAFIGGGGPTAEAGAGIGATLGSLAGLLSALGPYGPLLALGGGILGGLIGGVGDNSDALIDNTSLLEDNTRELKRNTIQLESLSDRIIGAPAGFTPPTMGGFATGGIGGGGVTINIDAGQRDTMQLAAGINRELGKAQRRGSNISPNVVKALVA